MTSSRYAPPIAVIGAGFSGTMAALQLLASLPASRPVLLCERAGSFGRGLAYGTENRDHLLNVRAENMSAFPDRPRHFENWLARIGADSGPGTRADIRVTPAGTFAARGLYGRYLSELLTEAVIGGVPRLHLVNDAVTDLVPEFGGFRLHTEGGQTHRVAGAVLANGILTSSGEPRSRHRLDPWAPDTFGRLNPHLPVLIVGTGLTMVDAVAALRQHGFSGPIVALSRRGLLPSVHAPVRPWPLPSLAPEDLASLPALLARIRAEVAAADAAGVDWRSVLDALRPITDFIWRSLPQADRARFLRHLRPFWEVHRHRTAPPTAAAIKEEIVRGSLSIQAGRIVAIEDAPAEAIVTIRPRGAQRDERLRVQCVLDATGISPVAGTDDPLLRRLIARGLVRPGPFGLGLDAGPDYRVRSSHGSANLWTLGPLLRGVVWECIAVPDIRNEAMDLAAAIASALDRAEAA